MFISEIKNILYTETISKVFNIIQQAKFVDGRISGGTPFDREDRCSVRRDGVRRRTPDMALRPASNPAGGEKDRAVQKVQRLGLREGDRHREHLESAAGLRLGDGPGALVKVSHLHRVHG